MKNCSPPPCSERSGFLNFRFQVIHPLLAIEGKKKPMLSEASFEAGLWSRIWLLLFMVLASLPSQAQTPTCQLSNKNGTVHQLVCHGVTYKIKAETSDENATVQWYRQNSTSGWTAVTGGTNTQLTANHGIYKAIFTHSDNSTCETENDTITEWKAYQIDWNVAACRAQISGATALPFPEQLNGAQEVNTPIDPNAEISFGWQVIPEPVQASLATSSNSIYPMTDGFFQDTTLGLHQVVLMVSQTGSECVSVDTMEVVLLPLNVTADTIISYGGQPAIAVAHASGGTEPYSYTWSSLDTCLSAGCDSVVVSDFSQPITLTVLDQTNGCTNTFGIPARILPIVPLGFLPGCSEYPLVSRRFLIENPNEGTIRFQYRLNSSTAFHNYLAAPGITSLFLPVDTSQIDSVFASIQWADAGTGIQTRQAVSLPFPCEWKCRFISPDSNEVIIGDSIILRAAVSESVQTVQKIEFFISGQKVGEKSSQPYEIQVFRPPGIHTARLLLTEDLNKISLSRERTFQVLSDGELILNAPEPNAIALDKEAVTFKMNGTQFITPPTKVEFYSDGSYLGEGVLNSGDYILPNILNAGSHYGQAKITFGTDTKQTTKSNYFYVLDKSCD